MARGMLRTIAHSLMVHTRVAEAYIHLTLIYTADHIFPVLPVKDLINEDGKPTTPFKLATGTKPSLSNLWVLFCLCIVQKSTDHVRTTALKMRHQAQRGFWYLCWNSTASERVYFLRIPQTQDCIFVRCHY